MSFVKAGSGPNVLNVLNTVAGYLDVCCTILQSLIEHRVHLLQGEEVTKNRLVTVNLLNFSPQEFLMGDPGENSPVCLLTFVRVYVN